MFHRNALAGLICAACLPLSTPALGQTLTARLSPVPITVTQQSTVSGLGSAKAAIKGDHVDITGAFDGLKSAATTAEIHRARPGLRGPVILDLPVTRQGDGTKGLLKGGFDLTAEQRADLLAGRWYIQLNSEKAADGNLWGWLLAKGALP